MVTGGGGNDVVMILCAGGGDVIKCCRAGGDIVVIYGSESVVVLPSVSSFSLLVFTSEVVVVKCGCGDVLGLDILLLLPLE